MSNLTLDTNTPRFFFLKFVGFVHSPLFFLKIIEIEHFALLAAILHECQNYFGEWGRGSWGEARKIEGL